MLYIHTYTFNIKYPPLLHRGWGMSWKLSLTLSQLGTKSLHVNACGWIFISAITQHETKLQKKSASVFLLIRRAKIKISNALAVHPVVPVGGREMGPLHRHQLDDSTLVLWKREKGGKEDQRLLQHHVLFSVFLSSAHSLPAFSKRNVRPEVCVLYSSTQIRLVPDLGNINNSLEMYVCEWVGVQQLAPEAPGEYKEWKSRSKWQD